MVREKKTKNQDSSYLSLVIISGVLLLSFALAESVMAQTLSATLSANPSSGPAPLNNVSLTATVSGTATGPITYRFDCTGDGSWELVQTSESTSYTAVNLCNYPNPGTYTAKIEVIRNGLAFLGATGILVQGNNLLSVTLSANPSSGPAPLQDVDLTATVSGTATGPITYRFDCTNDGIFERTITTSATIYVASNLCDYPNAGQYIAKVKVERGGLSFQSTTAIEVTSPKIQGGVVLNIDKLARNITDNQTNFTNSVTANPSEIIEFQIKVTSAGQNPALNVQVKDTLPLLLTFEGPLKIDGLESSANIFTGLSLGNLNPGQTKIIVFKAKVAEASLFSLAQTTLINTAFAYNDQTSKSDALKILVLKTTPTIIPTGSFAISKIGFWITLVILVVWSYFYLLRYYFKREVFSQTLNTRAEKVLEKAIQKARERRGKFKFKI